MQQNPKGTTAFDKGIGRFDICAYLEPNGDRVEFIADEVITDGVSGLERICGQARNSVNRNLYRVCPYSYLVQKVWAKCQNEAPGQWL